ncbi:MAG: serine/threonine protein kinase, partial [Okeania sp. SIO2D1]|nr:serine/threonine protein kinase [Okeania sp. SIO2D1]
LIKFNQLLGYWECDLLKVVDAAITDEVVEFMAGRLQKLSEATQRVLKLAACIGNQFELETLAVVCETSLEEVAEDIWDALQEGLILPISEAYKFFQGGVEEITTERVMVGYRFLHDRVQQAAYSLIPEGEKQATHWQIGQLLLQNTSVENIEDKIFEIVNQLNIGLELIIQKFQRRELAQLNFIAGKKAKIATAYTSAFAYSQIARNLLLENHWEQDYEFALSIYELVAETAYLSGNITTA